MFKSNLGRYPRRDNANVYPLNVLKASCHDLYAGR
jgi:hypothetical protein